MTPERWQKIKEVLEAARDQPPGDRREWLVTACDGDAEFEREVASFLEYEDRLEGFIEEPVLSFLAETAEDLDAEGEGRRVGPYRLVRLLGQGGMGAVYLAERQQELHRLAGPKQHANGVDPDKSSEPTPSL
jgi:serine/threonine protein kinase